MKILILGASGMLGNAVLRVLGEEPFDHDVFGTVRGSGCFRYFTAEQTQRLIPGIDVLDDDQLVAVLGKIRPEAVINCVGVIKQQGAAKDPLASLPLNAMLPHRLARLCDLAGARLVHVSTDCVYTGNRGNYVEIDPSDARDLYGMSKYLGEVDYPNAVTLRTSIIGHELGTSLSLVDWFLSQRDAVDGFERAIFSGLPTDELARVIGRYVLTDDSLTGLYHVSADPIAKYELLRLLAEIYDHRIPIRKSDRLVIDRSLDSTRFRDHTGYRPAPWSELIRNMRRANPWRHDLPTR
ncbi:dTDP-4-dehydrorhamnose reductase family protein [Sphingomonas sp. CFBP 8760]|uniref:dTDP-4-dehydrorhamnose reductase family protein n=1 Tax=Sphingomonas sp. CFBP 8760 TaxID=2775282 RepID=UPI0017826C7D|nr:SDR family oxidoreductase [Sphingomonas sp. CFBP 8760]MBD8548170.1 SDR family oxidoreductase [Sphingomonas sp. CFBP 8760]